MKRTARKFHGAQSARTATERLEARVLPEQKMFFQRAAALRGVSFTDFMIDSMREAAVRAHEEHELITLTAEQRQIFVEALLNPPAPNQALRVATQRYKRMVSR